MTTNKEFALERGWLLQDPIVNDWYIVIDEYDSIHSGWIVLRIYDKGTSLHVWAKDPADLWITEMGVTETKCKNKKQYGEDYGYLNTSGFLLFESGKGRVGQLSSVLRSKYYADQG